MSRSYICKLPKPNEFCSDTWLYKCAEQLKTLSAAFRLTVHVYHVKTILIKFYKQANKILICGSNYLGVNVFLLRFPLCGASFSPYRAYTDLTLVWRAFLFCVDWPIAHVGHLMLWQAMADPKRSKRSSELQKQKMNILHVDQNQVSNFENFGNLTFLKIVLKLIFWLALLICHFCQPFWTTIFRNGSIFTATERKLTKLNIIELQPFCAVVTKTLGRLRCQCNRTRTHTLQARRELCK